LKIKTAPTIIWLAGLMYLLLCIMTITDSNALRAAEYLVRGAMFVCCVKYLRQYQNKLVLVYGAFFVFYLFLGIINGNKLAFLTADLMSFFVLIFVIFLNYENRDELTLQLVRSISLLLIVGSTFSVYFFITNGLQPAESLSGRLTLDNVSEGGYFKYALSIIQVSVLLLPFFWYLDVKRRCIVASATILFFIVSAFTLARAGIAVVLVSGLITMYIGFKQNFIRFSFFTVIVIATGIIGSLTVFYVYGDIINTIYSLASLRFEEFGGEGIEPRDLEAEVYFANASLYELIVGKGFGGVNSFPFGRFSERGMMMLHRGENNLILKGGIPFLVLLYGSALVALIKLLRSKAVYSKQWAAVIFLFLFLERGHQQYSQSFMLLLFCLAISYGLNVKGSARKLRKQ
jgi:hypothetical protein